ncbi:hypothetical protein DH2020_039269 [Rehmannia glutinosa]|uniref:Transcription factor IIIC subunit Tfc1/Sfc1 triple barrel domain-containing protein n=1 Tax=Rehmannia glutinosa TaxID=99300 RepID=A0ABR0UXF4_REHGL
MGVIKDGSISGILPSSSEAFAVHYPGYPSSSGRAIETLGGNQGILKGGGASKWISGNLPTNLHADAELSRLIGHFTKPPFDFAYLVRTEKSNKLELHFRPEDPYSHPAFGELQPCNNYLLKISKKKVKDNQNMNVLNSISEHASADSLQHKQNILIPQSTESTEEIFQPERESFSASSKVNAQINEGVQEQLSADIVARVSEAYHFNEKGGLMDVDQDDLMILVPPLFSTKDLPERIVLKSCGDLSLKKKQEEVVQPRRVMQMEIEQCLAIDFNIKDILIVTYLHGYIFIPKKVNWENSIPRDSDRWRWQMAVCELFDERPIWVKHSLAERLLDQGLNVSNNVLKRLKSRWEDICAFRVFPRQCQISLQLFELKDDYIQQEIRKPTSQGNCSLQTGWFSAHMIDSLRLRVAHRFLSVYPEPGAESLLKTVSNRFQKSKRLLLNIKDMKVDGEEKQTDKDIDHENISKDYLQELFGSFPFGADGGNEMQNPDPYDGEFQIYEQFSDGNYSDNEDY